MSPRMEPYQQAVVTALSAGSLGLLACSAFLLVAALLKQGSRLVKLAKRFSILLRLGISGISAAGSLAFSEVFGWMPCQLCWYQRAAMYPLAALFILALVWKAGARMALRAAFLLSAAGAAISGYHYWLQMSAAACGLGDCAASPFYIFGFVTIPLMALAAFAAIIVLGLVSVRSKA